MENVCNCNEKLSEKVTLGLSIYIGIGYASKALSFILSAFSYISYSFRTFVIR